MFARYLRQLLFKLVSKHRCIGVAGEQTWSESAERPWRIWGDTINRIANS